MKKNKIYPSSETVTINCDASFHQKTSRGGWACWISYTEGKIQKFGTFMGPVYDAHEAEIKALCNGFRLVEKYLGDRKPKMVFVNCDNQVVRHIIKTREVKEKFSKETAVLLHYLSQYELVIAKTINGHQRGDTPRQWVNNWCDEKSRNYLNPKI